MDNTQLKGFAPATKSVSAGALQCASKSPVKNKVPSATTAADLPNAIDAGGGSGMTSSASASGVPTQNKRKKRGPKKKGDAEEEPTTIQPLPSVTCNFEPLSLPQIKLRISALLEKLPEILPSIPSEYNPSIDQTATYCPVTKFANELQVVIEKFNLLLSLVNAATYRWGVDRSGASQQNLSVMSAELGQCQETISSVVSSRISNVLCPAVDVMVGETEIIRDNNEGRKVELKVEIDVEMKEPTTKKRKVDGNDVDRLARGMSAREVRRNTYVRPLVDPSYMHLCHQILARNGLFIRHTVASSIHTARTTMGDYLKAMEKETGHESKVSGWA